MLLFYFFKFSSEDTFYWFERERKAERGKHRRERETPISCLAPVCAPIEDGAQIKPATLGGTGQPSQQLSRLSRAVSYYSYKEIVDRYLLVMGRVAEIPCRDRQRGAFARPFSEAQGEPPILCEETSGTCVLRSTCHRPEDTPGNIHAAHSSPLGGVQFGFPFFHFEVCVRGRFGCRGSLLFISFAVRLWEWLEYFCTLIFCQKKREGIC